MFSSKTDNMIARAIDTVLVLTMPTFGTWATKLLAFVGQRLLLVLSGNPFPLASCHVTI